jgi:hypothetical protein
MEDNVGTQGLNREKADLQKRNMERKMNALDERNSIFLMPVGRDTGWEMVRNMRTLDKAVNNLKKQAGFVVPVEEAVRKIESIDKTVKEIWELVFEYLPWARAYKPEDWRKLNDSDEEKKRLALRRASTTILPRDDRIGAIAMGIKLLNGRIYELQAESKFEELERLANSYREISGQLEKAANSFNNGQ